MGLNKTTQSWVGRESGVYLGRVNISETLNAAIKGIIKILKIKSACLGGWCSGIRSVGRIFV